MEVPQATPRKNYDSTFCGSLPLHQINIIQSHGVLLVLRKEDLQVVQLSENAGSIFNLALDRVVGQSLAAFIQPAQLTEIQTRFARPVVGKLPITITVNGADYLAQVHAAQDYLIAELEKAQPGQAFGSVFQELRYVIADIESAANMRDAFAIVVQQLKKLTGFDKILIYQFDRDWNGTVVAEVREPDMEAYMGLTFPASDIPAQARAMYQKNPYRNIPNREYEPVKLYPLINPLTEGFINLGDANLRGVAAVHLEYMKNMQIMASMSTRILYEDRLWGLISCHHKTAKYMSYDMCAVFELLSEIISAKIVALQHKEQYAVNGELKSVHASLVEQVYAAPDFISGLLAPGARLLELLQCSGVAISYQRQLSTLGNVPPRDLLRSIIMWLQGKGGEEVTQLDSLPTAYEEAHAAADVASGLLIIPIDVEKGAYILGFRPEVIQEIKWGGNPDDAITFEKNSTVYHPRHSFSLWQQTVRYTAQAWTQGEMEAARNLQHFLLGYLVKKMPGQA